MRSRVLIGPGLSAKVLVSLLSCGLISGCGSETIGPKRIAMSGQVTFANGGAPLPKATMMLSPEKGHDGPSVMGAVENGKYKLTEKNGPSPGAYVVKIVEDLGTRRNKIAEIKAEKTGEKTSKTDDAGKPRSWEFNVTVPEQGPFAEDFKLE